MRETTRVLVSIVTFNSGRWIESCLQSVFAQSVPVAVRIFDNASRDETRESAGQFPVALTASPENVGFSRAHNENIADGDFDYVLVLNPDVVLDPSFIERLLAGLTALPEAGMAGGKLLRMDDAGSPVRRAGAPLLDTTGIYFTPAQRHFDRGSNQEDRGQYDRRQQVFGISGAALLASRRMLDDIRDRNEVFDEDFFTYREDADLAWRAQLRGWKAVYEPAATGFHRRAVLPANRSAHPAAVNFHSLKNRYLMRLKNMDPAVRRRCFPHMWLRDAAILGYVLARERSSLKAYAAVRELRPRFLEKRQFVQGRRRVLPADLARWFSFTPVAFDL